MQLLTVPAALLNSLRMDDLVSQRSQESAEGVLPPTVDIPMPKEDEIFPNRKPPEEEEYLPDEQEVIIEEPKREGVDPYFPGKGDEIPLEGEEEFPQTDPQ